MPPKKYLIPSTIGNAAKMYKGLIPSLNTIYRLYLAEIPLKSERILRLSKTIDETAERYPKIKKELRKISSALLLLVDDFTRRRLAKLRQARFERGVPVDIDDPRLSEEFRETNKNPPDSVKRVIKKLLEKRRQKVQGQ